VDTSSDYREIFSILNTYKVKYMLVGAYAVTYYSEPRFTKDLDIYIKPDLKNANRVYKALKEFGAPLKGVCPKDFTDENMVFQIGVAPIRVDIMMGLAGVKFDSAWKKRIRAKYADVPINILGIRELIKSKKKTKRLQDRLDLERLIEKVRR